MEVNRIRTIERDLQQKVAALIAGAYTFTGNGTQYTKGDGTYATFPTNVSTFTNDASYTTLAAVAGVGYSTATSTTSFTNKSGNISQWTNNSGYLTALTGALLITNNLSDLNNAGTARTNLGLGTLATQSGTFSGTSSGTNTGDQNLSAYATIASPTFTGTPATPTAAVNTNTTQVASTAFVVAQKTILGSTYYDPTTATTYTTSSATIAALDTTNLRVVFTAPPSGTVIVKYGAWITGNQPVIGILESSTIRGLTLGINGACTTHGSKKITGLTAGTSYTYDLAYAAANATSVSLKCGGNLTVAGEYAPAYIEIISA